MLNIVRRYKKQCIIIGVILCAFLLAAYLRALFLPGMWHGDAFLYRQKDGSFVGTDIYTDYKMTVSRYDTKPFSFDILCARIRAMLRVKENVTGSVLEIADLSLDTTTRVVKRGDTVIELSSKEYSVLEYLMRNKGIIVSKEKIENEKNHFYQNTNNNMVHNTYVCSYFCCAFIGRRSFLSAFNR